jgi:hypothetical protein
MKTIIEMAREAGFVENQGNIYGGHLELEAFAALVAAAARADEREECAKMFEPTYKDSTVPPAYFSLADTAKIIRARGNT